MTLMILVLESSQLCFPISSKKLELVGANGDHSRRVSRSGGKLFITSQKWTAQKALGGDTVAVDAIMPRHGILGLEQITLLKMEYSITVEVHSSYLGITTTVLSLKLCSNQPMTAI